MEERRRRVDRLADRGWGDRGEQALEIDERWKMGWKLKCSPCVLFFPRLFDESVLAAYFPFLLSLSLSPFLFVNFLLHTRVCTRDSLEIKRSLAKMNILIFRA